MKECLGMCAAARLARSSFTIAFAATLGGNVLAQFSLEGTSLQTGGTEPLVSATGLLHEALPEGLFLRFRFSYGTDELPTAGEFKDAFSISLFGDNEELNALLLTADVFGLHLTPENPGGIEIPAGSLQLTTAEIPAATAAFGSSLSFNVQAELPTQFIQGSLNLRVDLFDNGNSVQSLGYIDQIAVVPEPGVYSLAALFISIGAFLRRAKK